MILKENKRTESTQKDGDEEKKMIEESGKGMDFAFDWYSTVIVKKSRAASGWGP